MDETVKPPSLFRKILRFPLVRIFLGFIVLTIASAFTLPLEHGKKSALVEVLFECGTVAVVLWVYYGFVRLIERRNVTELAFPPAFKELMAGVLVGVLMFSSTIAVLWMLGYYHVTGVNGWSVICCTGLTIAMHSGVWEELLFRGILFQAIEEYLGTWVAIVFSAAFFGFVHIGSPHATVWSAIAIAIEAGILLAASFVFTRRLWMPIGMHFAWNLTQGAIFGVAVSGIKIGGFLQAKLTGPALLSGGEFGAEASIFAVLICFAAGIYFTYQGWKKQNFIAPFWKRPKNIPQPEIIPDIEAGK